MINEHERVIVTVPLPNDRLVAGDVGTVVHVYQGGSAFEVEFIALDGQTTTVETVDAAQVRPVRRNETTHARERSSR